MIQIHSSLRVHDATYQCSLPTEEFISSLSTKGKISMSPGLSLKYAKFILNKGFVKIFVVCSSLEIY
jgi:hypothetical protein